MMDVAYQLDAEWPHLAAEKVARALPRWQKRQPELRYFDSPGRLLAFLHSAPAEQTDAPLLALLALTQREHRAAEARTRLQWAPCEGAAGRTLVQVLLPGLKRQAARLTSPACPREEVWEALLYFAWETICDYPLARRRIGVASKLYFDVLHRATRELHRKPAVSEEPDDSQLHCLFPPQPGGEVEASSPEEETREAVSPPEPIPLETVLLEGIQAGVLGPRDAELILLTRVDRIPLSLLARTLAVSYHALRQRRQRAEVRLRELVTDERDVSKSPILTLVFYEGAISPAERARALTLLNPDAQAGRAA